MYNINFNKTTRTKGLPSATVHRERLTNSNCQPQSKRPEQGYWEQSDELPSEGIHLERNGTTYLVKYCKRKGCIIAER